MDQESIDSFKTKKTLSAGGKQFDYFSLRDLEKHGFQIERLPFVLKILLENLLRTEDGCFVTKNNIEAVAAWDPQKIPSDEISFSPSRILLQDFTGVPAVVDLAAMKDVMSDWGGDAEAVSPLLPAEMVIDHSVVIDSYGRAESFFINQEKEYSRNLERYVFLKWGESAFKNLRIVPPDTGIVHQINIEHLARVVFTKELNNKLVAYPDTVVGTDSHTTMVNGLGVLGWGVGGIEAEAAMLGQPIPILVPQVIGFELNGVLARGATATDLVLTITQMLRRRGVVGKFIEFCGTGITNLSLADRATISNMCPEFGATCAVFPIDKRTLEYLRFTGRLREHVELVEAYARAQGLFYDPGQSKAAYTETIKLDLGSIKPVIAGPSRPHDIVELTGIKSSFNESLKIMKKDQDPCESNTLNVGGEEFRLKNGSVVIAAITSCTNTSNPSVMIGAGLLAKKAVAEGLSSKPWVKTSLAPGSKVVTEYFEKSGLAEYLNKLGFNLAGYGCTTCIGNSGPLAPEIAEAIEENKIVACSVLSGNRNFEGRINSHVRANYLASPALVVAFAIAGNIDIDLSQEPLGVGKDGRKIYLKDIWPADKEIQDTIGTALKPEMFSTIYKDVFQGDEKWNKLEAPSDRRYAWRAESTYVRRPSFLLDIPIKPERTEDIHGARLLAALGDFVTTDHISPAGTIQKDSPAGKYLYEKGVEEKDFNSYGSRRGNHEVMVRGTFANIRLKNSLGGGKDGGWTRVFPQGEEMSIYDASVIYRALGVPLIIFAGKEYGSGSSRDWAAKGTKMLGVRAVIAESFERIHRSNLIGMGVLPLQFIDGQDQASLGLSGEEAFDISGIAADLVCAKTLKVAASTPDGATKTFDVICRIDTPMELEYYKHGGVLPYVLRKIRKGMF